eukprot:2830523-Rhodomonas_salina.2
MNDAGSQASSRLRLWLRRGVKEGWSTLAVRRGATGWCSIDHKCVAGACSAKWRRVLFGDSCARQPYA